MEMKVLFVGKVAIECVPLNVRCYLKVLRMDRWLKSGFGRRWQQLAPHCIIQRIAPILVKTMPFGQLTYTTGQSQHQAL